MVFSGSKIKNFTDLNAWKEAHKLVLMVYEIVKSFPREEKYGLNDQIRRAAVSISSNMAEGFSRHSSKEKIQFYSISKGSSAELQNQLFIAKDVGYINQTDFQGIFEQSNTVGKLLTGLIKYCKG